MKLIILACLVVALSACDRNLNTVIGHTNTFVSDCKEGTAKVSISEAQDGNTKSLTVICSRYKYAVE